ncbi:MAG: putative ABC transporter permease, partial [Lachnospiraceae bacterium]|nr:putative ABC transporter permease [Lachnospiraceae bacterium]
MMINIFLELAFLFFMGSLSGWGLEVIFRRFFSDANPERKWINPGFLAGPYLPLYGFSLCALFLLAHIKITFIV